ncbi:MAG TPA: DUF2380 domain-containing protein [Candidatus Sulfotelmatobacter sp.]|nr:DUF2380 domain-containing protein [Candidatus Sulfotelmatobacter sp.]
MHLLLAVAAAYAVLPLTVGETGLPDAIAPSVAERGALVAQFERQARAADGVVAVPGPTVARALERAGYDQNTPYRACASAACARAVGRALHVRAVVYGSVTRYMALIWGMDVTVVDVRTGAVTGPFSLGYKGDYAALYAGEGDLSVAVAHTLTAR